ncbi:OmpA family protein [Alkalilimnicola ehrlichii MLHE-1]|uniref:OmpA/MotB domain protein n=1 Tax=Alkalilimnicola ehrlichii (strain ATCC BAA-1101 / DSM 17681 / MLHE-1) TaxID=187272 RepID=Q0A8N3_ALKEH|nr:OmpA family protein [Alkalilimnicola ehrlichii]ABI56804.1 OmpA/MotB domain protein [Alkalilimnicola ehrlichii MLHE-1]
MNTRSPIRSLVCAALLVAPLAVPATARAGSDYLATPHQSRWNAVSATHGCHLVHRIPRFATVLVSQSAEQRLVLSLYLERPLTESRTAELAVRNPAWRDDYEETLATVELQPGRRAITLGHYDTQHLLTRLEQGRQPALTLVGWYSEDPVRVGLSPVAFRNAYEDFLACTAHRDGDAAMATGDAAGPLPDWARQGHETAGTGAPDDDTVPLPAAPGATVYFGFDHAGLTRTAKDALARFANQAGDDPHLQVIVAVGHTDSAGPADYNERLGARRAEAVRAELMRRGIADERIRLRSLGERQPAMAEDDGYGRAANRRVEVRAEY